jgi:hypothetical protein
MKEPKCQVHGEHQEFAMGKIDDLHNPKDQGQANACQGVYPANQNTRDE